MSEEKIFEKLDELQVATVETRTVVEGLRTDVSELKQSVVTKEFCDERSRNLERKARSRNSNSRSSSKILFTVIAVFSALVLTVLGIAIAVANS